MNKNDYGFVKFGKSWREFVIDCLNNTGTIVIVNGEKYLIGDINNNGGGCDCCPYFEQEDIVDSYKDIHCIT